MIPGVYSLGSGAIGLNMDTGDTVASGITIEGYGDGNEFLSGYSNLNDGGAILVYSGTGEAIRFGRFTTTAGNYWMEGCKLKDFKLRQSGTVGTGIGILLRLFRWGIVENVNIQDFSVGMATASVSDFNVFDGIRTSGNTTTHIEIGRSTDAAGAALGGTVGQCNANRFTNCDIKNVERDTALTNWGLVIHGNSVGNIVRDSEFQNFDTATYGAISIADVLADSSRTVIDGNYFEGNYISVYHSNPFGAGTDFSGLTVSNNYIAQIESIGVQIQSGSTGTTRGITIEDNLFQTPTAVAPYDTAVGINLGTYVSGVVLKGNVYRVQSPLGYTLAGGNIVSSAAGYTRIENEAVALVGDVTLSVGGATTLTGAVGCGAVTSTGNVTSGGHIRGLKATEALTTSAAITTAGRMLIDITNTSGTNTPTLVAPSSVDGQILILRCVALTAGTITLADSGNVALSAAWIPDAGDTLTLIASGVIWYEIARSAN
jgi:hypothetical protein